MPFQRLLKDITFGPNFDAGVIRATLVSDWPEEGLHREYVVEVPQADAQARAVAAQRTTWDQSDVLAITNCTGYAPSAGA